MNIADYNRLKEQIEADYKDKIKSLETIWNFCKPCPCPNDPIPVKDFLLKDFLSKPVMEFRISYVDEAIKKQ